MTVIPIEKLIISVMSDVKCNHVFPCPCCDTRLHFNYGVRHERDLVEFSFWCTRCHIYIQRQIPSTSLYTGHQITPSAVGIHTLILNEVRLVYKQLEEEWPELALQNVEKEEVVEHVEYIPLKKYYDPVEYERITYTPKRKSPIYNIPKKSSIYNKKKNSDHLYDTNKYDWDTYGY